MSYRVAKPSSPEYSWIEVYKAEHEGYVMEISNDPKLLSLHKTKKGQPRTRGCVWRLMDEDGIVYTGWEKGVESAQYRVEEALENLLNE